VPDLDNDNLAVEFEPARVGTRQLIDAVAREGFTATIVTDAVQTP
jgi:hypothetical protein